MKITDLSKKNENGNPLEIMSYDEALERYKIDEGKYYESDKKIVKSNSTIEGSIYQYDEGTIEEENKKDFKILHNVDNKNKNINNIDHEDNLLTNPFRNDLPIDLYNINQDKSAVNILERNELGDNIPSSIISNMGNQDETDFLKKLGNGAIAASNIGNVIGAYKDLKSITKGIFNIEDEKNKTNSLTKSNIELDKLKEDIKKDVPLDNYQESIYYNELQNINNTSSKILRGDLTDDITNIGKTISNYIGPQDDGWEDKASDIAELNLSTKYNMYTNRAGHTPLAKNNVPNVIDNNIIENVTDARKNLGDYSNDVPAFSKNIITKESNYSDNETDGYTFASKDKNIKAFSPNLLSDAQARTFTILKNKNTFNNQVGYIHVKPFYSVGNGYGKSSFKNFNIPFEFKPQISEGSITAKYQAENLLNRIGSMQVFTGNEPSTLNITASYIALSPDEYDYKEADKQFSVNAWEYYWTDSRIEELELKYRSLVYPVVTGENYLLKPPIIQIKMVNPGAGFSSNDSVGYLYKYPYDNRQLEGGLSDYFKVSSVDIYKKYIVSSVQIDNVDDDDLMTVPSLYEYSKEELIGTEGDGINSHINFVDDANYSRKRGFKVTLTCIEVNENFVDIVPDFAAYYNAWSGMKEIADNISSNANTSLGADLSDRQSIIDSLTADSNTLSTFLGTAEERIKKLLEKAYFLGNYYCYPEKVKELYNSYFSLLLLTYPGDFWKLSRDKRSADVYKSSPEIIKNTLSNFTFADGFSSFKPKVVDVQTENFITNKIYESKGNLILSSENFKYLYSPEPFLNNPKIEINDLASLELFPKFHFSNKNKIITYKGTTFLSTNDKEKIKIWKSKKDDTITFYSLSGPGETLGGSVANVEINFTSDKDDTSIVSSKERFSYKNIVDNNLSYYLQTYNTDEKIEFIGSKKYLTKSIEDYSSFNINCNKFMPKTFLSGPCFSGINNSGVIYYLDNYFEQVKILDDISKSVFKISEIKDYNIKKDLKIINNFISKNFEAIKDGRNVYEIKKGRVTENEEVKLPGINILVDSFQQSFNEIYDISKNLVSKIKDSGLECDVKIPKIIIKLDEESLLKNKEYLTLTVKTETKEENSSAKDFSKLIEILGFTGFEDIKKYISEEDYFKDITSDYLKNYKEDYNKVPSISYDYGNYNTAIKNINDIYQSFMADNIRNRYMLIMENYENTPFFYNLEETNSPNANNFYSLKGEEKLKISCEEFINYEFLGEIPEGNNFLQKLKTTIETINVSQNDLLESEESDGKVYKNNISVITLVARKTDAKAEKENIDNAIATKNENIGEEQV